MENTTITFNGGIDDNSSRKNLTGSNTVLCIDNGDGTNSRVFIDYGMFQGNSNDDEINSQPNIEISNSDHIILTHAHIDHSGRIPYLIKNGFKGNIYMTPTTLECSMAMCLDYIRLTRRSIEIAKEKNKKIYDKYKKLLKIKNTYENSKKKNKGQTHISIEEYNNAVQILKKANINTAKDISNLKYPVPTLLYDELDVYKLKELTILMDVGETTTISTSLKIDSVNDKRIDNLATDIARGIKKTIYVGSERLKNFIINRAYIILQRNIDNLKENKIIIEQNEALRAKAVRYLQIVESGKENVDGDLFLEATNFLNYHKITCLKDIENALGTTFILPFTKKDINELIGLIKIDRNKQNTSAQALNITFLDAGHIEGSVQASVSINRQNINGIMEQSTILFTGDLGRMSQPNLSGKPTVNNERLISYLQIETTYAGRNHPDKEKSLEQLYSTIRKAKGKVIIPCFSMQRTQEILIHLVEYLKDIQNIRDLIDDNNRKILLLKKENKGDGDDEIEKLEYENFILRGELKPDFEIILDSPLSSQINSIYLKNYREKYSILSEEEQLRIFGKVIIRVLEAGEYKSLYQPENINKKQVIISASGMCQGGSILNHLKYNLGVKKSTIVFVGYTPPNTIGGYIKRGLTPVIEGQPYKISCNVVDIEGFSGHIDEAGILEYIGKTNFNIGAIISLTHGGEKRSELADRIRKLENVIRQKVTVLVPSLGDTIEI